MGFKTVVPKKFAVLFYIIIIIIIIMFFLVPKHKNTGTVHCFRKKNSHFF